MTRLGQDIKWGTNPHWLQAIEVCLINSSSYLKTVPPPSIMGLGFSRILGLETSHERLMHSMSLPKDPKACSLRTADAFPEGEK